METLLLIAVVSLVGLIAGAVEWITRRGSHVVREEFDGRGPPQYPELDILAEDGTVPRDVVAQVYERADLLQVDELRGVDAVEAVLWALIDIVITERDSERHRPSAPTAILLHGPPGVGMAVLAHMLARHLRARLVHVFASAVVPTTNGGSQPIIAPAVNQACHRQPSVLLLDELEVLAGADVRDSIKLRAANDLLAESLRWRYGPSPVVIAAFTTYDVGPLPRRLTGAFRHIVHVDVTEFEWAMVRTAIRSTDHELFRAVPAARLLERRDLRHEPPVDFAA